MNSPALGLGNCASQISSPSSHSYDGSPIDPSKEQTVAQRLGMTSESDADRYETGSLYWEQSSSRRRAPELTISSRALRNFPEEVMHMPSEKICLDENELTDCFPTSWGQLGDHLQTLSVQKNKLTALSSILDELKKLKSLNASHNSIGDLPDTFRWPPALKVLHLSHNLFTTLPESLKTVPLRELHIQHNPLKVDEKLKRILLALKAQGCNINCNPEVSQQFTPPLVWEAPKWDACYP